MQGVFKFAHLAGAAFGGLFLLGFGIVAASGPDALTHPFGSDERGQHAGTIEDFKGTVVEISQYQLVLARGDDETAFGLTGETRFQDANGHAIEGESIDAGALVLVFAQRDGARWVAVKVRLVERDDDLKPPVNNETPTPTKAPEPTPTPKPEVTPEPEPTYVEQGTEAVFEGWVKEVGDGYFLLKQADYTKLTIYVTGGTVIEGDLAAGATARVEALVYPDGTIYAQHVKLSQSATEFWGVVTAIGDGFMLLNTEFGQAKVYWRADTLWAGDPFTGVKVIVTVTKNPDGSYTASKVIVKTAEFSGTVASVGAGSMNVNAWDSVLTVKWNAETAWQGPDPYVGAQVWVAAFKMGDGTFLATKIVVKSPAFTGTVTAHMPGEFTINVLVGSVTKVVCYEFADVIGTLAVGKTVYVEVDHTEAGTYFAGLVKVLN